MSSTDLNARLENLTPTQRVLLERKLMERRAAAAKRNAVVKRDVASPCPLSYSQELLWLLSQVFNDGVAYNAPGAYRVQGPLDLEVLKRALEALVKRHEVLRTTYSVIGDHPMQVIHDHMDVEVAVIDLSDRPQDEKEAETARILQQESVFTFDLVNGPVMRPTIIRHAPDDHVFMLVLHHIATDGYSRAVIYGDLTRIYDSIVDGLPSPLEPLPIQYADYAVWHRRWLDEGAAAEQLDYWKTKLKGAPSRLDLPTDFPRPPVRAYVGAYRSQMLDVSLREALRDVARGADATLFVALVSLFALPARTSRRPGGHRPRNTLRRPQPQRVRADGRLLHQPARAPGRPLGRSDVQRAHLTDADDRARRVRQRRSPVRDGRPRDEPRSRSQPDPGLPGDDRAPQPRLAHQPTEVRAGEGSRPPSSPTRRAGRSSTSCSVRASARSGLNTTWEYSTELFREDTIAQLMRHFRTLGESAAAHPDRPLSQLSMLSTDERRQVIGWSGDYTYSPDTTRTRISSRPRWRAARTPPRSSSRVTG